MSVEKSEGGLVDVYSWKFSLWTSGWGWGPQKIHNVVEIDTWHEVEYIPMRVAVVFTILAYVSFVQGSVLKRCDITDPLELFEHINKSATTAEAKILEGIEKEIGPHLKVGVVTPFKSLDSNHSIFSLAVNEYYAKRHGYVFKIVDDDTNDDDVGDFRITWNAVKYLREGLRSWAKNLDYVLYMDSTMITVDMKLRLEQLAAKHKKSNVIFVSGGILKGGAKVSTDIILVKNTVWTLDLLDDWWHYRDRTSMSDTEVFDEYYKMHEEDISDFITIINLNTIKNDYPAMTKLWKNNQFLHLPLEAGEYKRMVFEDAFDAVCDAARKNPREEEFPWQLGITKEKLTALSAEVYRDLWQGKYDAFEARAEEGSNTYADCQILMTLASHLAQTLDNIDNVAASEEIPTQNPEATRVRGKTFKQLYVNLKRYRTKISNGAESAKRLAEKHAEFAPMLKTTLKGGQDFIAKMPQNFKEKKTVIKIVRDILEDLQEIKENDPDTQEALVNMNVDMGMINMNDKKYEAALADFLAGLRIARKVGVVVGDLVVLAPASHAADAMVLLERYEEAVVLYLYVVQLAEKHHGQEDLTTAYIKVQAAMANEYYKKYKKAHKLIQSAIDIMQMYPPESVPENIYTAAVDMHTRTKGRKDEEYEKDL